MYPVAHRNKNLAKPQAHACVRSLLAPCPLTVSRSLCGGADTAKHGGGLTAASNGNEHLTHAKNAMKSLEAMKFAPKILNRRPSVSSSRRGSFS